MGNYVFIQFNFIIIILGGMFLYWNCTKFLKFSTRTHNIEILFNFCSKYFLRKSNGKRVKFRSNKIRLLGVTKKLLTEMSCNFGFAYWEYIELDVSLKIYKLQLIFISKNNYKTYICSNYFLKMQELQQMNILTESNF